MVVLISDDDLTTRTLLAGVLENNGYEVVKTACGIEALTVLNQPEAPQLVVLDWMMPGMDGLQVVEKVRSGKSDQPPYIILLTAKTEKSSIITGLDRGADDYLTKPFDTGELLARVGVGRRFVEMREALVESRKALEYQATHDPLTGMLNRRATLEQLQKEINRAARHGGSIAVGMCDIDNFKVVNDRFGHQTGDEILAGFSSTLMESLREYDTVGRIGGEEFLVITPMRPGSGYRTVFERLLTTVAARRIPTRSGFLSITVSIGVACAKPATSVDMLLEAADSALYKAKEDGRNRVVFL
jgi:two-component system, cell cycle response regulator